MDSITVSLPEDRLRKLRERASSLRVSPEELVRVSIEELLSRPDPAFEEAVEYAFRKSVDLCRRLA